MPRAHVEIILAHETVPLTLHEAVQRTGVSVSFRPLSEALRSSRLVVADAVVIVGSGDMRAVGQPLRVLFDRLADPPRAVLVLRADGGPVPELAHPETVPVTFGCGLSADELTARLATMLDMRPSLDSLHQGLLANRRLEQSTKQLYQGQLRLASQVQREFIPEALPAFGPVSFKALFRPADYVSGDIYDVHRLDEDHVALALADATGHGIPAALLTVFIKRALRGKEVRGGSYRILPPDEVLSRLNEELVEANLSECRFVAATYAVLNTRTLELTLARGGSPYPILRRKDGTLRLVRPTGGVIGVLPEAEYAAETVQLHAGDSMIICSDGVESVVLPQLSARALAEAFARAAAVVAESNAQPARVAVAAGPAPVAAAATQTALLEPSAPACAACAAPAIGLRRHNGNRRGGGGGVRGDREGSPSSARLLQGIGSVLKQRGFSPDEAVLASSWCVTLRDEGPGPALDQLTSRYDSLRRMGHPVDDLTVLALEVKS